MKRLMFAISDSFIFCHAKLSVWQLFEVGRNPEYDSNHFSCVEKSLPMCEDILR
jgi:hypothetical protein